MDLLERLAGHYDDMSRDDWRSFEERVRLLAKRDAMHTAIRVLAVVPDAA